MLYCFDNKMCFDYTKKEIELLKRVNSCIFYDSDTKLFLDSNGKKVDIKGEIIFPRTGSTQIYDMNDFILKNGGIPIISSEEVDTVLSWPSYYKSKRKVLCIKGSSLVDKDFVNYIEQQFGSELFIKTREKNFSYVIPVDLLRDRECAFYKALKHHDKDTFFISEKINIKRDNYGPMEYRCFVIGGKLYNISRKTTHILHRVEKEVIAEALRIIDSVKTSLPSSFVVDLCIYTDDSGCDVVDVVEFNPIHAAGIYLYNSVIHESSDLEHNNLFGVAREFKDRDISDAGVLTNEPSNYYEAIGTFAGDLRSIRVNGDLSLKYSDLNNLTLKDFAAHEPLINDILSSAEEITSDDELFSSKKSLDPFSSLPDDIASEMKELLRNKKS